MHEGIIVFCIEKFFLVMIPVFSIASLNFVPKMIGCGLELTEKR